MRRFALCAAAVLGMAADGTCRGAIIVDPFSTSQTTSISGAPAGARTTFSESSSPSSIGGFRDIFLTRSSSNAGVVGADSNDALPGAFAFSAGLGTAGFAVIQYDGLDGSQAISSAGLGGVNLIEPGTTSNRFVFSATSDLGGDVTVRLYSGFGNASEATFLVAADPTFSFATYLLPFTAFVTAGGSGANFANVGAIEVEVGRRSGPPVSGLDLAIDSISVEGERAVPEPSALALTGLGALGLAGFGLHRWRRRMALAGAVAAS